VAEKTCQNDPDAMKMFFLKKTEQIPANWVVAHAKANDHGDEIKMQIEQIKLDTVAEIRQVFEQIWEEM